MPIVKTLHQKDNVDQVLCSKSNWSACMQVFICPFSEHFVWNRCNKVWRTRRHNGVIGRVLSVDPAEGERYYLQILLKHVKGPTSFESFKTIGWSIYSSFREASQKHVLIGCDNSIDAPHQGSNFSAAICIEAFICHLTCSLSAFKCISVINKIFHLLSDDYKKSFPSNNEKAWC